MKTLAILLVSIGLWSGMAAAKCIPFTEAENHIGDQTCVTGQVVKVAESAGGTFFLNFCEKYRDCPFTVVVFPSNLKNVGDVRQLEGKTIEIFGKITRWRGHAEIVLRDARQLKGESAKLRRCPGNTTWSGRESSVRRRRRRARSRSRIGELVICELVICCPRPHNHSITNH